MELKQHLLQFMNEHMLMVIATVGDDTKPEAACIGFGQTDKLELIFGTPYTTRKAHNITFQPNIAAVIGWDDKGTVQYEGVARQLDAQEAERYADMYYAKNPSARKHNDLPEERYFLVTPKWLRYSRYSNGEWATDELRF